MGLTLFSLVVFFGSSPNAACPWLSQGSAAKALGGPVRVVVNVVSPSQGSCTFARQDHPQAQMKVFAGAGSPACPAGSVRMSGIGNEASRCHLPHSATQMISGRVRATDLAVTLSGTRNADELEQVAEQVAGNLF